MVSTVYEYSRKTSSDDPLCLIWLILMSTCTDKYHQSLSFSNWYIAFFETLLYYSTRVQYFYYDGTFDEATRCSCTDDSTLCVTFLLQYGASRNGTSVTLDDRSSVQWLKMFHQLFLNAPQLKKENSREWIRRFKKVEDLWSFVSRETWFSLSLSVSKLIW